MSKWIAAISGWSGSGKSTLIVALVRHFTAEGRRVSVIKHSHHPASVERAGDTELFLEAGAVEALLCATGGCTRFTRELVSDIGPCDISDLPLHCVGDVVLLEGWKGRHDWLKLVMGESGITADLIISDTGLGSAPTLPSSEVVKIARFIEENATT